jgi:hypothetical protein
MVPQWVVLLERMVALVALVGVLARGASGSTGVGVLAALVELRSVWGFWTLTTNHCLHACQRMHLAATAKTPIATPTSFNGFSSQN